MQREDRYLVFKRNELIKHLDETTQAYLINHIAKMVAAGREAEGEKPLQCVVVVESDWPEYEKVWEMISARVDAEKGRLLGWTLEEFAVAVEVYRTETGKGPLSTLEGAREVQAHWIISRYVMEVDVQHHPFHQIPVDLGWARALFGRVEAMLEKDGALRRG